MENKIKHVGVVEAVDGECVHVRIVQSSACAACKAAKQCQASESKDKTVDVFTGNSNIFQKGQSVMVMASYSVGWYAVTLGMIIPMFLLIIVLVSMTSAGCGEMKSALASLLSLIPYYLILYIFRKQVNRKVTFNIEPM